VSIKTTFAIFIFGTLAIGACGDDDEQTPIDGRTVDAHIIDATPDADTAAVVARGKYLVDHVAACVDCHTPRLQDGSPDLDNYLAGIECFIDVNGDTAGGCLNSRNLTNHATGLMNVTDAQIKTMFQDGERPDGSYLVPLMPYWIFHNMTDDDADAIVAYLRTVTGVDHTVPASDPPFTPPKEEAAPLDLTGVPMPTTVNAHTMNGRYLAAQVGACIDCHTALTDPNDFRSLDATKYFAGARAFPRDLLGLPPVFPEIIYSMNLTPDPTGIMAYEVADIIQVLHEGVARDDSGVCPPMPVGPMGPFGGLTDEDAADIAAFIKALPAVENQIPNGCEVPQGP
jgi:mono/diheme cytochrome c family protein